MKKRQIAYISGTRADFGLMSPVLSAIKKSPSLDLQLYATGIHLMKEFGLSLSLVEKQFPDVKILNSVFSSDERSGTVLFASDYLNRLLAAFKVRRPDICLVLGDRIEMLCSALACLYLGIPVAHVHGGEKTFTVDELARHAITKLSHIHFAATAQSADRIAKLGEETWRIHTVGAPALDVILNQRLPSCQQLFKKLNLDSKQKIILVVQHPVSEQVNFASIQMEETLKAVTIFNLPVIISYPHADAGGKSMIQVINKYRQNPLVHIFPTIAYQDFLALEREAAVLVGNSSAGMIESSSFHLPVVNIGTRQTGRQRGENVIDAPHEQNQIVKAINFALNDRKFLLRVRTSKSPWGDGHTSEKIVKILSEVNLNNVLMQKQITY